MILQIVKFFIIPKNKHLKYKKKKLKKNLQKFGMKPHRGNKVHCVPLGDLYNCCFFHSMKNVAMTNICTR